MDVIDNRTERVFTADYAKKTIIVPKDEQVIGVKGDSRGRAIRFELLKVPDELDLSQCVIEVQYQNALGETGRQKVLHLEESQTDLAKEEAASKYVKNEAIGFNHFDIANMYGPSTGTLYGGYSEYRFAITAEYEADVPVTFRGGGGQIMTTQNISSKSGMKYAAFFVVKDTKTGDVQILFGQGDSPIIDPLQSGVLSIYTFGSNDGYVDSVEVGPMPERITVSCAMRG